MPEKLKWTTESWITPVEADSIEEAAVKLVIQTERPETGYWAAVWNGHQFETMRVDIVYSDGELWLRPPHKDPHEQGVILYFPIDPRMTKTDVDRATVPRPNETNTGWLFFHCDNDAMVDYEKELAAAVVGEFAEAIDGAQIKVNEATNATVRAQAVAKHAALVAFRNSAVEGVVAWARTLHIGWQEQNPHEAHVHTPALRAIEAVARTWQTDRTADYSQVSAPVAGIIKGLAKPHAYETRWEKKDRLDAESEPAAAESEGESAGE